MKNTLQLYLSCSKDKDTKAYILRQVKSEYLINFYEKGLEAFKKGFPFFSDRNIELLFSNWFNKTCLKLSKSKKNLIWKISYTTPVLKVKERRGI